MEKPWIYTTNFILTATEDSFANAIQISGFHTSALHVAGATDAAILALYTAYLPLDTNLNNTYAKWKAQTGTQKGNTLSFKQLLGQLTAKVNDWDSAVQRVHAKGNGAYLAIFPKGHGPFQSGTQIDRKSAVNALASALSNPALAAVKTDVTNFYTALNAAQTAKNDAFQTTDNQSDSVRVTVQAMATQQFANFGTLLTKYVATPTKVDSFFDLEHIRNHQQTDFSHTLAAEQVFFIAKRTVEATDTVRIFNTGETTLRFFVGATKKSTADTLYFDIAPGTNTTIPVTKLGDIANHHFLFAQNLDDLSEGSYELELL